MPAPEPTLSVEHFPHLPIVSRVLLPYLKSAVAGERKGVNILFYGPPGSGKTELTRVIAKELGLTGYEVQFAEKEMRKKEERTSRLKFWKAAGNVLSQTNTNLLVIDEAEDVFNDLGSFFSADAPTRVKSTAFWKKIRLSRFGPPIRFTTSIRPCCGASIWSLK